MLTVPTTCSVAKRHYLRKKITAISLWDKQGNLRAWRTLRGCKHGKCTKNKLTFHRTQDPNWVHKISTFPMGLYVQVLSVHFEVNFCRFRIICLKYLQNYHIFSQKVQHLLGKFELDSKKRMNSPKYRTFKKFTSHVCVSENYLHSDLMEVIKPV